jgi:hypothetical protein
MASRDSSAGIQRLSFNQAKTRFTRAARLDAMADYTW